MAANPKLTTKDLKVAKEFWTKVLRQRKAEWKRTPDNATLSLSLFRIREHLAFIDTLIAEKEDF